MKNKKILLVDDDQGIIETYKIKIKSYFPLYNVDTARDGLEALCLLEKKHYDILITDYHMPQLSGYEVAKKAQSLQTDLKIYLISSLLTIISEREKKYSMDALKNMNFFLRLRKYYKRCYIV